MLVPRKPRFCLRVTVCSIEDLKAMKQAAGRTRDLADLEDLVAAGS
jgi:hypothetical protein